MGWIQLKSATIGDFSMGEYVLGSNDGTSYFTNAQTNPLRHSDLETLTEVYEIGEVWVNMLHNVLAALINEHWFSLDALMNTDGTEGSVMFMHIFIDSLGLQPCNPTFVQARDPWIPVNQNRFSGANICIISKAFASRSLGANARSGVYVDDTLVLTGCQDTEEHGALFDEIARLKAASVGEEDSGDVDGWGAVLVEMLKTFFERV